MSQKPNLDRLPILGAGIVTLLILGLLLWEHFHGGVPSHHILQRKDLPEISNWWGAILLPLLSWFLCGRIVKRVNNENSTSKRFGGKFSIPGRFVLGTLLGLALAISFSFDFKPFLDNVLYIFLALGLLVPIFYAEFILGFVLGMTYTFGAILPTAFILILALVGFLIFKFLRPLLLKLIPRSQK